MRTVILPLFLAGTLGSIYFLPSVGKVAQSAIDMKLPETEGIWYLKAIPPTEDELQALAKDTEFSKAVCLSKRPFEYDDNGNIIPDRIDLSVVLSGTDINNSIHRPERCLAAQGHRILSSTDRELRLENGRSVTVKRLRSVQRIPTNEGESGSLELSCITYYFFVGHEEMTNDHMERTLIDMKDRLVKGLDQRWAYVSTSMWFGDLPWMNGVTVTEGEVDGKLTDFLEMFAEKQIAWDQVAP